MVREVLDAVKVIKGMYVKNRGMTKKRWGML